MDVGDHAKNNQRLFLIPHKFHDKLTSNVLSEKLKQADETGLTDFDPGLFLKEQVLENVTQVQVLIFGNTSREDAEKFCQNHIVPNFKTIDNHDSGQKDMMLVGCLH